MSATREGDGTGAGPSLGGAWGLLAFLVVLNTLNFIDRTLPQAFIVDITRDLDLTYTTFALVVGPLFAVLYAALGTVAGALADRVHRGRLMALGVLLWSAMTAATGAVRGLVDFAGARAMVAVGEASLSPSALSLVNTVFPPVRRGVATSLYYLGISLGAGSAYLIAGTLGALVGWRMCFLILGGVGMIMAAGCLLIREPRSVGPSDETTSKQPRPGALLASVREALGGFVRLPALGLTWAAAVLIQFSQGASILDQAWLVREAGMAQSEALNLVGVVFMAGSTAGALLGGVLSDALASRFRAGRLIYLLGLVLVLGPTGILLRFAEPGSSAFIGLLFLGSAGFTLPYGGLVPTIVDLTPTRLQGAVIGLTLLGMALLGTSLGNLAAGTLADLFVSMGAQTPLRAALISVNATVLLAVPLLVLAARRYGRDQTAARAL